RSDHLLDRLTRRSFDRCLPDRNGVNLVTTERLPNDPLVIAAVGNDKGTHRSGTRFLCDAHRWLPSEHSTLSLPVCKRSPGGCVRNVRELRRRRGTRPARESRRIGCHGLYSTRANPPPTWNSGKARAQRRSDAPSRLPDLSGIPLGHPAGPPEPTVRFGL